MAYKCNHHWLRGISTATTTLMFSTSWTVFSLASSTITLAQPEVELYSLCSKFPLNSRCEGYEIPVSLKQRSGHKGACNLVNTQLPPEATEIVIQESMTPETEEVFEQVELSGKCKIVLSQNMLTVYVEYGDSLDHLEEEKATKQVNVPLESVTKLGYREDDKIDTDTVILNTLAFGIVGALLTRPDELAQIEISFKEESESTNLKLLKLITERDLGVSLRSQLERSTGMFAEIPIEETPESEDGTMETSESDNSQNSELERFCKSFPYNSRCQIPEQESVNN